MPGTVPARPILFYDGACGLCARSVQWCLDHDRRGRLSYAPLQGSTWAGIDAAGKPDGLDTMVVLEDGRLHLRSAAVRRILHHAGGGWALLGALGRIVPRPLADALYRGVARRRHRFGKAEACRLPTPRESALFLP